ncbi:hypothetical protein F4805DRAFT_109286 [Annulohypoxylon moriforme]|nr:hypothetical protein F4805DRAFT_109286 [Annulohypoxylon moriforme]
MTYLLAYPISLGLGYLISRIYQAIRDRHHNETRKSAQKHRTTKYFLALHIILTCLLSSHLFSDINLALFCRIFLQLRRSPATYTHST